MTRRLLAAAALVAWGVAAGAGAGTARAQQLPAGDPPVGGMEEAVEITVIGKIADLERVRALGGARSPGGVPLRWTRADRFDPLTDLLHEGGTAQAVALRCWVDMTEARRVVLYFAGRGGRRFLVRGVELSGRFDEMDRQSLAQVLELSITALLESDDVGITPSEARVLLSRAPPPPAPVTVAVAPAPAPTVRRIDLRGALFYGAESLGSAMRVVHGPGLGLALRRGPGADDARPAFGIWIAGQYLLPASARNADVGVTLQTAAARVGVEVERWRLRARIGAGADWVRVSPLAGSSGTPVVPAPAHWSTSLVVEGGLALRIPVGQRLDLAVAASAAVLPTAVHYDVQSVGGVRPAFTFWRVRPGLAVEVGF